MSETWSTKWDHHWVSSSILMAKGEILQATLKNLRNPDQDVNWRVNTLFPAKNSPGEAFSLGTWNARGLFCRSKYEVMKIKIKHLKKSLANTDIFCVQEAHGNETQLRKHLGEVLVRFWAFCSFCDQGSKGGIITFVSKEACPDPNKILSEVIVPGRVLLVTISGQGGSQTILNTHNFSNECNGHLSVSDMKKNTATL